MGSPDRYVGNNLQYARWLRLRIKMEDPTWFWGGVQPWKPPPRHISSKRCGPLGHKYVQPTWETTYNKNYRKPTTTSTTQYFTKPTRYIPREKLRLCEVEKQGARPKLYHQQYSVK